MVSKELFDEMHRHLIVETEALRATKAFMMSKGFETKHLEKIISASDDLISRIENKTGGIK